MEVDDVDAVDVDAVVAVDVDAVVNAVAGAVDDEAVLPPVHFVFRSRDSGSSLRPSWRTKSTMGRKGGKGILPRERRQVRSTSSKLTESVTIRFERKFLRFDHCRRNYQHHHNHHHHSLQSTTSSSPFVFVFLS